MRVQHLKHIAVSADYTEEERKRALEEINTQRQKEFELTNAGFQQQQDGIDRCRKLLQAFQLQNDALKNCKFINYFPLRTELYTYA